MSGLDAIVSFAARPGRIRSVGRILAVAILLAMPVVSEGAASEGAVGGGAEMGIGASESAGSASAGTGSAQSTAAELAPLSVSERDALIGRLTDEQARALLLYYLQETAPAEAEAGSETRAASSIAALKANGAALRDSLTATLGRSGDLFAEYGRLADVKLGITIGGGGIMLVLAYILGLSLAGGVAEVIYRYLTRRMVERYEAAPAQSERDKLVRALGQLVHGLGAIAVFAAGFAAAFLAIWGGNVERREFVIVVLLAILVTRFSVAVVRFVFLPGHARWRIMPVDDEAAAHFVHGTRRIAILGSVLLLFGTLGRMWGADQDVWRLGALISAIIFTIAALTFLWRYRNHLLRPVDVTMGTGTVPRWAEDAAGWSWYALAVAYVIAAFLIGAYDLLLGINFDPVDAVIGFFILFVFNPYVTAVATGILAPNVPIRKQTRPVVYVTDPDDGERIRTTLEAAPVPEEVADGAQREETADEEAIEEAVESSPAVMRDRRVVKRVISMIVSVLSLVAFAAVIGVNVFSTAQQYPIAQFLLRVLLNVGVVALLGYIAWAFIASWIDRKLAEEKAKMPEQEEAEAEGPMMTSGTRLQTILPIIRKFIQITLAVMAVMVILASMGVNIAPLIAGAGVIGLAVGFGAQTLVKDLISGLFFLMDDAFRIGEYIEAGDVAGTVEKFNARSLVLRGYLGAVYTVPYGELGKVTNYSRDWVIMKLRFRVPYDADIDLVRKIFKKIGQEMLEDPDLGPNFLQPFKSQGVIKMDDSAFIVSGKFMTKPNKQWGVRKAVYEKVQQKFKEFGISFAPRRVIVDVPTPEDIEEAHEDAEAEKGSGSGAAVSRPVAAAAAAIATEQQS